MCLYSNEWQSTHIVDDISVHDVYCVLLIFCVESLEQQCLALGGYLLEYWTYIYFQLTRFPV